MLKRLPSPGMLARHYAPRTPARLFSENEWADLSASMRRPRAVVLSHRLLTVQPPHGFVAMPADAEGYAAALYAAMREADEFGADEMLIERPPTDGPLWAAIADRLARATSKA